MNATTFSVDLASQVFQVHGYDRQGLRVSKRRLSRPRFTAWCNELPAGTRVVMEATGSAHHWGRLLQARGVAVRLLPPQHVKAMLMGNKTDANDADAIFEASLRPKLRPVPVKSVAQQAMLAEHRVREARIQTRTRLVNQLRGLLAEFGIMVGRGVRVLRHALPGIVEDADNGLPDGLRTLLAEGYEDLVHLDARVQAIDARLQAAARRSPLCRRLQAVEGVGALTVTALTARVGDARSFTRARAFAASLGLVPREHSSGQRRRLGAITKRGNGYLRKLLIHGGRSVVYAARHKTDPHSQWINALVARAGANRAAVAIANKNARILFALLRSAQPYRTPLAT